LVFKDYVALLRPKNNVHRQRFCGERKNNVKKENEKSTRYGCLGCVLLLRIPWDEKTPKDPAVKVVGDEFAPPLFIF
jgi:hypothetical protein